MKKPDLGHLLRREAGFEVKFASGDPDGTFEGYGAVFGNIDANGDVIVKGAFKGTLREWETKGKLPKMLLQHGGGMFGGTAEDLLPVGQWTSMEENSKGLKVKGYLFALATEKGQYIYQGLKSGELDGLSIGFMVKESIAGTKPNDPRRSITSIDLWEVSIVTFQSNDKALVSSVKSSDMDRIQNLAAAEAFLREADGKTWSKNTAKDFVSLVVKISRREAGDDRKAAGLLEQLRSIRKLMKPTS